MTQQLPVVNLLMYPDLKRVILQRVGHIPEQLHQHFPLAFTQQFRDTCQPGVRRRRSSRPHGAEAVHFPTTGGEDRMGPGPPLLEELQLAEEILVMYLGAGEPFPFFSLSISLFYFPSFSPPSLHCGNGPHLPRS